MLSEQYDKIMDSSLAYNTHIFDILAELPNF